jgi:hypothetical protein
MENGEFLDADAMAQLFADFFKGKVEKLMLQNPIEDPPLNLPYAKTDDIMPDELDKAISSFKPKKASGRSSYDCYNEVT